MKPGKVVIYIKDSENGNMLTKEGRFCIYTMGMGKYDTLIYKQFAAAKKRLAKVSKKAFPDSGIYVKTIFGNGQLTEELTVWFPWNKIH